MAMTDTEPSRIRLSHHVVELDDGRQIGLSVGGRGVPLLFMHGLLLSRRAYLQMLSRIAGMGTERSQERMSWARRTYRRWAAKHLHEARALIRQNTPVRPEHGE
ncbi:hypothetical protein MUNTM_28170 [Mycobacterium sp. MUNTM1]